MKPAPKPRLWPRVAIGPLGNRATFHCMGDIPAGWTLEKPLPGEPVAMKDGDVFTIEGIEGPRVFVDPAKRKRGRPPKAT